MPELFDVFVCSRCDTSFALPMKVKSQLYDLIYAQGSRIPGYDRYAKCASEVLSQPDPLAGSTRAMKSQQSTEILSDTGQSQRSHRLRWLLLAIFVVGYFLTRSFFPGYETELLALSLTSALLCALLLVRLQIFAISAWPVWILLIAFLLGYYIKFYWLVVGAFSTDWATLPFSQERISACCESF